MPGTARDREPRNLQPHQLRSGLLLVVLVTVVAIVGVLGVRALTDLGLGLRALGGEDGRSAPADGDDGSGQQPPPSAGSGPPAGVPGDAQRVVVDRVVDGDTIRVRVEEPGGAIPPTGSVRVRLLNVDAPELDHPDRGQDCGALEATAFVERLVPADSTVWLVADVEDRDRYDRPLRAVFDERGDFVNAELVAAGWAEAVLFEPNDRFHQRMVDLEEQARSQQRGAWATCGGFP